MNLHDIMLAAQLASKNSGGNADLTDYYTKSQIDSLISGKVDKADGMVLSKNSFTDAEKSKLSGLENYDDTDVRANITKTTEQTALNLSTLGYQRKNLLKNMAKSQMVNGVMFTINDDGTVEVSGTAESAVYFSVADVPSEAEGRTMWLSGCPAGGDYQDGYALYVYRKSNSTTVGYDTGDARKIAVPAEQCAVRIVIRKDVTVNNLIFRPMLRYAGITDDTYETYRPSVAEYIASLEERIAALEGRT